MKKMIIFFMIAVLAAASFTGCGGEVANVQEEEILTLPVPGGATANGAQQPIQNVQENEESVTTEPQTPVVEEPQTPTVEEPQTPTVEEPQTPTVEEPQTPTVEEPQTPTVEEPQTPTVEEPQTPAVEEPQTPAVEEPKTPVVEEPKTPVVEEPKTPVVEEPKTPAVEEPKTPPTANQQDGLTTIQRQKPINKPATYTGDKYLLLVNPWNYLPADFKRNTVPIENHYIDAGAYNDIVQMLADMRKEGLKPYICSSTRTIEYQENLFNKRLKKNREAGLSEQDALDETAKWTAIPGTSEHHTGYALDIVSTYNTALDESQENTKEQQWMMKNSWKYGFILRYPEGKTHITGIYYEPWHYRYVGKTAAKEIYESGLTLEEYLGK